MTSPECESYEQKTAVLTGQDPASLLIPMFEARNMGDLSPFIVTHALALDPSTPIGAGQWQSCIVLLLDGDRSQADVVLAGLQGLYSDRRQQVLDDAATGSRVYVWQ